MSDIPPPDQPGWYADAHGAWWWWDGATWSPAPSPGPPVWAAGAPAAGAVPSTRDQERTNALLMWILYILVGGWIVALIFYLISKEKPFVRHHAAEALNLTLVQLVPQIVGFVLLVPDYVDFISESIDDPNASFSVSGSFWAGVALLGIVTLLNYALGIAGAVMAHRGRWWRLPIGLHPVRGVLRKGEDPPYDVTSS